MGIPRTRPAVAAVRGALWAVSDRQAGLLLTMTVQQRLATAEDIGIELLRVRRDKRRRLLHAVVLDLLGGARSMGELDVARLLRRRGLPAPDRQVLRRDGRRRYYLDLYWDRWQLVVEIDGIQHTWAESVVSEALRQNALSLSGDTVLRLPLLGLRLAPEEFLDQIEAALTARGWSRAA
jgi:very-short-patch-repair endonuclease